MDTPDSAGVRFPPPFLYAIAFAIGAALHRVVPGDTLPARWRGVVEPVALALVAVGLAVAFTAIGMFLRARTHIIPHLPATSLVVRGPYRLTRNPMYLSLAVAYAGMSLLINQLWPLALLPLALLVLHRAVIVREERYLAARFGDAYAEYRRRVPRWIGFRGG